jgi:oligosaccharide repeat unit polymerase
VLRAERVTSMISADLTIGLLVILVLLNYRLSRSILYPPFIFSAMWLLDIFLYRLQLVEMNVIHSETFLIVCVGAVLFSMGGIGALLVPGRLIRTRFVLIRRSAEQQRQSSKLVRYLAIVVCAVGVSFIVHRTFSLGAGGVGGSLLARARNAAVESANSGVREFPIFEYLLLWSVYLSVFFQLERRDLSSWIMVGITLVGCIFNSSRVEILLLISALTCIYLLKERRYSFIAAIRFIRWPILAFVGMWSVLIFTTKNTAAYGDSLGGIVLLFLVNYIVGPVVALDYVLGHPSEYIGAPHHTFKFFLSIASALHLLQYVPPPSFDEYVPVPFPTNVYTIYKFYITDFGLYGALVAMLVIGFFHTLLYRKALTGSKFAVYLFALTIYPAIMVIFDEQYAAFGSYLDILLIGAIYTLLSTEPMLRLPRLRPRRFSAPADLKTSSGSR